MAGDDPKIDMLKAIPMFGTCSTRDLQDIAQLVDEVDLPAGHVLMRQGDPSREMYILVSGTARADRDGRKIHEFGPGGVFGEMSLIAEGNRTATVTAETSVRALVVGHREFHSLMDSQPGIRMRILEGLAAKVRRLEEHGVH